MQLLKQSRVSLSLSVVTRAGKRLLLPEPVDKISGNSNFTRFFLNSCVIGHVSSIMRYNCELRQAQAAPAKNSALEQHPPSTALL
jgi:hypothetical protein